MSCSGGCGCAARSVEAASAQEEGGAFVSLFAVSKMDCPAEERMIRLALAGCEDVRNLAFDLAGRRLRISHDGPVEPIAERLAALKLGASLSETRKADPMQARAATSDADGAQASSLKILLVINAGMFVFELVAGLVAGSAGLIGDSLDMFADAAVYGMALLAVGRGVQKQLRAARVAGVLQLILALGLLLEVGRRFAFGSEPESMAMMAVSLVALLANVTCLLLITRHRNDGVHMKASWIFSANDVLINLGVILAGVLVAWTGSHYPDLAIGGLIGLIVLGGARRILALKN